MASISAVNIETIARAICARNGHDPDEKVADEAGLPAPRWSLLKERAQSDIEAFRDCQALAGLAPHMRNIR